MTLQDHCVLTIEEGYEYTIKMKGDYYKCWLKVTKPKILSLEIWSGIIVWLTILGFSIWGVFISLSFLVLIGLSIFVLCHHWGRLIISQQFYKRNEYFKKEEEKKKQEAYK